MRWGGRPDINALEIGDEVSVPISGIGSSDLHRGKVVYVHPKKRFFTVEFEETGIRESYCAYGPLN